MLIIPLSNKDTRKQHPPPNPVRGKTENPPDFSEGFSCIFPCIYKPNSVLFRQGFGGQAPKALALRSSKSEEGVVIYLGS